MEVLFTGGIGDVLALEAFWPLAQKQQVSRIWLACRNAKIIKQLFERIYAVPIEICWKPEFKFFCYYNEAGVRKHWKLPLVEDWSIEPHFPYIAQTTYYGSSALTTKLADLNFSFTKSYFIIVPDSSNEPRSYHMTSSDWKKTIELLEEKDCLGVVLNTGLPTEYKHDRIIDLTNKTTICESIEILKGGIGYIGIDSCLSVLGTKLFDRRNIRIKSSNPHLYRHLDVYFAPHESFGFVGRELWC